MRWYVGQKLPIALAWLTTLRDNDVVTCDYPYLRDDHSYVLNSWDLDTKLTESICWFDRVGSLQIPRVYSLAELGNMPGSEGNHGRAHVQAVTSGIHRTSGKMHFVSCNQLASYGTNAMSCIPIVSSMLWSLSRHLHNYWLPPLTDLAVGILATCEGMF